MSAAVVALRPGTTPAVRAHPYTTRTARIMPLTIPIPRRASSSSSRAHNSSSPGADLPTHGSSSSSDGEGEGDAFDAVKFDAKRLALDAAAMAAMQKIALDAEAAEDRSSPGAWKWAIRKQGLTLVHFSAQPDRSFL